LLASSRQPGVSSVGSIWGSC